MKQLTRFFYICFIYLLCACTEQSTPLPKTKEQTPNQSVKSTSLIVLGTIQDAGFPQIGCTKECCAGLFGNSNHNRQVSSLGLIDSSSGYTYLFDATPDISSQVKLLTQLNTTSSAQVPNGIFLTHAHIGHYTGLMYLGKEAMNATAVKLYVMPRMKAYLSDNGPWSQLVSKKNVHLQEINSELSMDLSDNLKVTPFTVPHRDEFSETVGYSIQGPQKTALFIPDIDKWNIWNKNIIDEIKKVDYAFLDATFYNGKEINNRDISQISHPFIIESLEMFKNLNEKDRAKIIFIHFNHTNPVINPHSEESKKLLKEGFRIARRGDIYEL